MSSSNHLTPLVHRVTEEPGAASLALCAAAAAASRPDLPSHLRIISSDQQLAEFFLAVAYAGPDLPPSGPALESLWQVNDIAGSLLCSIAVQLGTI